MQPKLIAIVGQTATGKSSLGIALARKLRGTIVSADSRQVYRGLDIGSGKVTKQEQRLAPHVLLDVANPRRSYTVANYIRDARRAIKKIFVAKRVPIVVGGTGFWIDALLSGTNLPAVRPNPALRKKLSKQTAAQLFRRLQRLDPKRAEAIDRHNPVRLIRALEIVLTTKKPVPIAKPDEPYNVLWLGLRLPPKKLRVAIHTRLQRRMRAGLVAEVRELLASGVPAQRLLDLGLEYRFVTKYLQNKLGRNEMLRQLETAIVQYAKRQKTWFKRNPKIHWIKNTQQATKLSRGFLKP
jgi:tRNA dimethylallyltransferase